MNDKITLSDIAAKMNTSIVTVSNVLNGKSGVSNKLREDVLRTAQEMGYHKKSRREKASLSMEESVFCGKKIGVVVSERYLERYTSFYWRMYQSVVMEASREGGFVLLEVLQEEREKKMQDPYLLEDNQIDALIILGSLDSGYLRQIYHKINIPMIFLDFNDFEIPCDAVISNGFFGMYQMTNYLIRCGHRKIAFFGEYKATGSIMDRYQGYCKSLIEHGIEIRPEWVIPDRDPVTGRCILAKLPEEMPTAFACNCDLTAEELAESLVEQGYRIPEDISIASFDDFLLRGIMLGHLTTYAVDMDAMARESLKLISKRWKGELTGKTVRTVDGKPVIRDSVTKINEGDSKKNGDYI